MRTIAFILTLLLSIPAMAQVETYTSSGKAPGVMRKQQERKQQKKGFDPSRMIYGGTLSAGGGNGAFALGIMPMVGYRITDKFGAGLNFGYQYIKVKDYIPLTDLNGITDYYDFKAGIATVGIWARYLILPKLFVHAGYERNFLSYQDYRLAGNGSGDIESFKRHLSASCVPVGLGYRAPVGQNISMYFMGVVDVLQLFPNAPVYSPYYYDKNSGILSAIYPSIGVTIGF